MSIDSAYESTLSTLQAIAGQIGPAGLTASQAGQLDALLSGLGGDPYTQLILNSVIQAGGAAGTTQAAFSALIDQWFLGADDPAPLPGNTMVNFASAPLFPVSWGGAYHMVQQGYENGDCWLVAALVEAAAISPSDLTSAIWANGNGTYGIRFYSPTGPQYLTVNADLMVVQGQSDFISGEGANSTDGTLWAGLLEKAYAEAQGDEIAFSLSTDGAYSAPGANSYATLQGGWDEMLKALTGRNVNNYGLGNIAALAPGGTVYQTVSYDLQNGLDVLLASNTDVPADDLIGNHMYAVTGIDLTTGNYILTNPWGQTDPADAETSLSAAQLNALTGTGDVILAADGGLLTAPPPVPNCYLRGTLILTPRGLCPIERLVIGDEVITRFGGLRPIKWIAEQKFPAYFLKKTSPLAPVRIAANALAECVPRRDLLVSAGHSMLLGDVLVLARDLVNGVTITQAELYGDIHYFHIELDTHDCILAEGAWSETYANCAGHRALFHNAAQYRALYPHEPAAGAPRLCAKRPEAGPLLDAALFQIIIRAERAARPPRMIGCIERLDEEIQGWAADAANPGLPVRLKILCGAAPPAICLARGPRPDIHVPGLEVNHGGFQFPLPAGMRAAEIVIGHALTGERLEFWPQLARASMVATG
jgi:hypothetical protein